MGSSFGEDLKRERELREIPLQEISEATKISVRFLQAIEENNFDLLPGGIFNVGFIRAYAHYIGVDDDEMVNNYLYHQQQLEELAEAEADRRKIRSGESTVTVKRLKWVLLIILAAVVLAVAGWLLFIKFPVFDRPAGTNATLTSEVPHRVTGREKGPVGC